MSLSGVNLSVQGKIKSLEQIYLFSMPVKEYQIVEQFLGPALKDEVMKIMPVQKQTRAGQRTRFKVHDNYATLPLLRTLQVGEASRTQACTQINQKYHKRQKITLYMMKGLLELHPLTQIQYMPDPDFCNCRVLFEFVTKHGVNSSRVPLQAFVVVGDFNGHVGLGVKCAKEVNLVSKFVEHCHLSTASMWLPHAKDACRKPAANANPPHDL